MGVGRNAPVSCFNARGVLGGQLKHPHHIEMREGGVVWVEMPLSHVSMRGGCWGVVETQEGGVGRNAPVSHFDARGALGSGQKVVEG